MRWQTRWQYPPVADRKSCGVTIKTSPWQKLKNHFREAFSEQFEYQRNSGGLTLDGQVSRKRGRDAYRYILLLLACVLAPMIVHDFYTGQTLLFLVSLVLLLILLANIWLLGGDRDAFLAPTPLLLLGIGLILLAVSLGQRYSIYWLYPLLAGLPVLLHLRQSLAIGLVSGALALPLVFSQFHPSAAVVISFSMATTWLVSAWLVFAVTEQSRRLKDMAITDALTGAYNRRYLDLQALKALELWRRYQRPASLLILDIDYFKRINDKHGHNAGDAALKSLVDVISQRIRAVDTLCRFGGDEFVLLLSETGIADAETVANKLRLAVEDVKLLPQVKLTISVGIAAVTSATDLDHWLNLADTALYLAKKKGRNRVELAESVVPQLMPIDKTVPTWR